MPRRGAIDFDLDGIGHVLEDASLAVPVYQRSFAWADDQINDFWADLSATIGSSEPEYFLGTLVLSAETPGRLTVIDGQQRLATTGMLLACIRDHWTSRGDSNRAAIIQSRFLSKADLRSGDELPKLVLSQEDDDYFRKRVIQSADVAPAKESHKRISGAMALLAAALDKDVSAHGAKAEERLHQWVDFLVGKVVVITVEVPTEADAFLIFETLNDRGADLTIADLLKNYLFGRAGTRIETVKANWLSALSQLDITAENDIFVAFLRHYWSSRYGATRERDLYKDVKKKTVSEQDAVDLSVELSRGATHYAALLSSSSDLWAAYGPSARENVDTLLRLELEQYRPLMLAVLDNFSEQETKETLRAMVSWAVRGLIVGGIGGGTAEKAYCSAAMKVRSGTITDAASLASELSAIVSSDEQFQAAFAQARVTKAKIGRYLLNALQRQQDGVAEPELVPNANEEQVNLEHVLPKNAKPNEWPAFAPDDVETWAHRIGNFALLSKGPNGRIGNKAFALKKPVLAQSQLSLTSDIATASDWTKQEIADRQEALSQLAVLTWPRLPA